VNGSLLGRGECPGCDRGYYFIQPEAKDMLAFMLEDKNRPFDVYILDEPETTCSVCGHVITLLPAELLDRERNSEFLSIVEQVANQINDQEDGL
jgi:hypothetical protein